MDRTPRLSPDDDLGQHVLQLIRTRRELYRWRDANSHGRQMHDAVALLEAHQPDTDPAEFFSIVQKALMSSLRVLLRADDSSGIIGDAARRLLELHPRAAAAANVKPAKLVDWMMKFQFEEEASFFELDVVEYASALGENGVALYRRRLQEVAEPLGPEPAPREVWSSPHSRAWWTLHHNARRLAVLDRDVDEIIRTHARDYSVAKWLEDTSQALEEIGEIDLAIEWARRATDHDLGFQSSGAARRWVSLVAAHRPEELVDAAHHVFFRWPTSGSALSLRDAAGDRWPEFRAAVQSRLRERPDEAVLFAIADESPERALKLAFELGITSEMTWDELARALGSVNPGEAILIHFMLAEGELREASARNYREVARRLRFVRALAADAGKEREVDEFIASLREAHRRRPRLQQEFTRAGLP